jgi:hypothetical protein
VVVLSGKSIAVTVLMWLNLKIPTLMTIKLISNPPIPPPLIPGAGIFTKTVPPERSAYVGKEGQRSLHLPNEMRGQPGYIIPVDALAIQMDHTKDDYGNPSTYIAMSLHPKATAALTQANFTLHERLPVSTVPQWKKIQQHFSQPTV